MRNGGNQRKSDALVFRSFQLVQFHTQQRAGTVKCTTLRC